MRRTGPRRTGTTTGDENRAVSDVVAFVLTFSIIITSVGVVSAVGFSVLRDVQSDEQALNAQRGFQTLGESLNEIDRTHSVGRSGEIDLNSGSVFVRDEDASTTSNLDVNVDVDGDGTFDETYDIDVGTVFYRAEGDGTRVAYESGAVIRKDKFASQAVIVQKPNIVCRTSTTPKYAAVSVVKVVSDDGAQGGDGVVQIVGRERSTALLFSRQLSSGSGQVQVQVDYSDSRFTDAWNQYFERNGDWSTTGTTATCDAMQLQAIVRRTVIKVDFVG